jgi:Protein of unknown function (DUF3365)
MQRSLPRRGRLTLVLAGLVGVALLASGDRGRTADKAAPSPAAVARTRETVRMLDDMYKSAVVHITKTYVSARERTPAARAAQLMFKDMASKGWHEARLIDATGEPSNRANLPRSAFERKAVQRLKAGQGYYEEVGEKDGKAVLRAATPVPAVMAACTTCHPHVKEGQLMGALVYELPIK